MSSMNGEDPVSWTLRFSTWSWTPKAKDSISSLYDVIVAFQVLHATSSIDNTLVNCRKLLRPGGFSYRYGAHK